MGGGGGDEEDGRRVGDTGCDEAVDLICSPAPSSSLPASVTCVLSYLSYLSLGSFSSLLFVSPRFIFLSPLTRFHRHFSNLLNSASENVHFLFLVAHCSIDFLDPFVPPFILRLAISTLTS